MTVDLFGFGNTFRAMSPFQQAVNLAHQAARQRLEAGGTAAPTPTRATADLASKRTNPDLAPGDFVLPLDVDPEEVRKAIETKLGGGSGHAMNAEPVIERRAGGRITVPAHHLLRLGDGRFDRGRRFMHGLVKQIRARRALWKKIAQHPR
jgi:hypothetical protein